MTTTELIEILRKNESGGASGRPREVSFCVGDRIISTDGIEVTGSGDGLTTELYLSLPDAEPKKGHWFFSDADNLVHCSACGQGKWKGYCPTPKEATEWMPICPQCGAKMEPETDESGSIPCINGEKMHVRTTDECNEIIREMFDHWDDLPDGKAVEQCKI